MPGERSLGVAGQPLYDGTDRDRQHHAPSQWTRGHLEAGPLRVTAGDVRGNSGPAKVGPDVSLALACGMLQD